jgi:hypothetical protein
MKHAFLLVLALCAQAVYAETPDELAKEIIASDTSFLIVEGQVGTSTPAMKAANQSIKFLKEFMLNASTSEKLRISYAISLLKKQHPDEKTQKEIIQKEMTVLGVRFLELSKKVEQDAAANP